MEMGMVQRVDIDQEMQQCYLDYAMSVIVSRALPDARDGLKPVQRRILYAMYDMGVRPESSYKKSARIVGEVLGKYHPHGDMAVYEAMARLAQDFTMRNQLVDGQGNFGSVDGDPPAAMRYTEARLAPFAMELLSQIDRNTVQFSNNFDGTLTEPDVLPAAVPNLLVNGASGIAVGMATSIPPHNLGEVVDALIYMLNEWEKMDDISPTDLMKFIQGPDFPTGGIILQEGTEHDLLTAYATGRGRVVVRGRVQIEEMGRGKSRIIITELPYMTNKSALIERIADLVRNGDLEGVSDLRDESDRHGMRIVIELNKVAEEEKVLRSLYHRTPLQSTIGFNLLALVGGEPRLLTLKQALKVYLEHRLQVIQRRSEYDLEKAKQRAHILEGLRIALKNLDEVIKIIRNAADAEQAKEKLMKRFQLSAIQTQAILDMPLRRLASLERKKIELEYKDLMATIKELEGLLRSPKKMREVVETELIQMKQTYSDRRRTQIVILKEGESAKSLLTTTDLTPAKTVWVGVMQDGHIARTLSDETPRLSGKDSPRWLIKATTHHTLYLVSTQGKAAAVSVEALPEAEKFSEGIPLSKASALSDEDTLAGLFILPGRQENEGDYYILSVTRGGMVKKTSVQELPGPSAQCFTLVKVNSLDEVRSLMITDGSAEIMLVTAQGMAIRFSESEVRPMGLIAIGVNGIKMAGGDEVASAEKVVPGFELLLASSNAQGWRIDLSEFPLQGRYGQGIIACKPAKGTRLVGSLLGKKTQTGILHFRMAAAKSIRLDDIPVGKRARSGTELTTVKAGDELMAVTSTLDGLNLKPGQGEEPKKRIAKKSSASGESGAKKPAAPSARQKTETPKVPEPAPQKDEEPKKALPRKKATPEPAPAVKKAVNKKDAVPTGNELEVKRMPIKKEATPTEMTSGVKTEPEKPAAKKEAASSENVPNVKKPSKRGSAKKQGAHQEIMPEVNLPLEPLAEKKEAVQPASRKKSGVQKAAAAQLPLISDEPAPKKPARKKKGESEDE
jgi:DNA gyrase subunit A